MIHIIVFLTLVLSLAAARLYMILPSDTKRRSSSHPKRSTCNLAVFLGSGGHTTEALALVSAIDPKKYHHRQYIVSEGDHLSAQKAKALESSIAERLQASYGTQSYSILTIPRARRVHQSLLTTPASSIVSLFTCVYHVTIKPNLCFQESHSGFADVLILNGPGTCFILCVAVYINKFLGLPAPVVIYVESFARITSLSLSGKLLRPLVDRFVVQWPQLLSDKGRGECVGWLV
ncbi:glycosyltransferase family 1 protein [Laccaria amethystina LaAM-08-1]|uniref:UDP-N-acetylglucosamine transferase subunit ALG14 n=1 Tax=Laccaria amethystina LaAM-08-1 TaxID=1095629 RepID=A0A0C9XA11_9AGAR|nr:glycosyltransferase family 1 protein [Laccaria amethystina LaAM-08-1]